jgi:hypothetical protein
VREAHHSDAHNYLQREMFEAGCVPVLIKLMSLLPANSEGASLAAEALALMAASGSLRYKLALSARCVLGMVMLPPVNHCTPLRCNHMPCAWCGEAIKVIKSEHFALHTSFSGLMRLWQVPCIC